VKGSCICGGFDIKDKNIFCYAKRGMLILENGRGSAGDGGPGRGGGFLRLVFCRRDWAATLPGAVRRERINPMTQGTPGTAGIVINGITAVWWGGSAGDKFREGRPITREVGGLSGGILLSTKGCGKG